MFAILGPDVTGIDMLLPNTSLPAQSSGTATWTFVPGNNAAPYGATEYRIGGTLFYNYGGVNVSVPLYPDTVTYPY
jgi:hypothetical protein